VAGRAEPGATVQLTVGAHSATLTAGTDGAFEATFDLAAGAQAVVAVASDAAGNVSPQARLDFVAATTPVTPPIQDPPATASPREPGGGCGCSQGAGAASGLSLLLLGLAAGWPRRRGTRVRRGSC
jgi:uncharacterized protein (TIGR03382 family)